MRDAFVRTLIKLAEFDKNVICLTGDLGFGVLKPFWEKFPDQFIDVGIAEQNMTGLAAGMALCGKTVFTYSIGNFPTLRCLEQIRNDCAYHNADIKIVCVGGGFAYGPLGMSHHATEDIAVMRALPGVTVMVPADLLEAEKATEAVYGHKGTCYLRLGRGGEKQVHEKIEKFSIGKAIKLFDGEKVVIFTAGAIAEEAVEARTGLKVKYGIEAGLYTFPTVKPLDRDTVISCAEKYDYIFTVEEHNITGGFGGAVAEALSETGCGCRFARIGLEDTYASAVGSQQYLREYYGISSGGIVKKIRGVLG